jgi:hypothetical protein
MLLPRPKSAISADKMNVYRGVVNPMTISLQGSLQIKFLLRLDLAAGGGKYNMSPTTEVVIDVTGIT